MNIIANVPVTLDPDQVEQVFRRHLESLKQGRWVRDGKLWEEQATSHRFDVDIGDPTHPDYELVAAVQHLEHVLKRKEQRNGATRT